MPFQNENTLFGLPVNAPFQVGRSSQDSLNPIAETGNGTPWPATTAANWVYYESAVECMLDSGIVVHNCLPSVNNAPDTLGTSVFASAKFDRQLGGINLTSNDQYKDIVQRMGHARYWFRLRGRALRVGYPIPIPTLKSVGGVPCIPHDNNPQWAFNRVFPGANYGGVVMWHAEWSLWYTCAVPPVSNNVPVADPSAHVTGTMPPPAVMQFPYSMVDDNVVAATPPSIKSGANPNVGNNANLKG